MYKPINPKSESADKKPKKWPDRLGRTQNQSFDCEGFYVITYEGGNGLQHFLLALIIAGVLLACMFPVWPMWAKVGIWYLSVIFLSLYFGLLILRMVIYTAFWVVGFDFWIFPNINDEYCGFLDSFQPVYSWEKRKDDALMLLVRFGSDPIDQTPQLEGVRGFGLMTELTSVADFYIGNGVVEQMKDMPPEYPVTVGKMFEEKVKEEMYGVYAWNAVTCQDSGSRDRWERAKPHVGGILGLSPEKMEKVLVRMVSRWCNMFIKQKIQENGGKLSEDDASTLTDWVPMFFGIDKQVTKDMVQSANKGLLVSKAMRLLNSPSVTQEDIQQLRDEVENWDLRLEKDLELSRPQLRSLFRVEVTAVLEDRDLSTGQKQDSVDGSREAFGLAPDEALEELRDLLKARARGCLANAVGDFMQGNENQAVTEVRRLELLAAFAAQAEGLELDEDWEVAPSMRQKLLQAYMGSALAKKESDAEVDVGLLQQTLGVAVTQST